MWKRALLLVALALIPPSSAPAPAAGPSAADVVQGYLQALGGRERLAKIDSVRKTGRYVFNGVEYPLTIHQKRPNLYRFEIVVEGQEYAMAYDGHGAWLFNPFDQEAPVSRFEEEDSQRLLEEQADFDGPLIDWQGKGHRLQLLGQQDVDGKPCYHLELRLASGRVQDWFLAADSYLLTRKHTRQVHHRVGEYQRIWFYGDHRPVAGVLFPHYYEREDRQFVRTHVFDEIEINPELPDDLFQMPRVEQTQ